MPNNATPSGSSSQAPSLAKAEGTGRQPRLRWLTEVWRSTVGKKLIVGVTGVILAAYVILHMLGNLKTLQGNGGDSAAAIDTYAEWLRTFGEPLIPRDGVLWAVRVVLLTALVVHVAGVSQLIARNRMARPEGHRSAKRIQRSIASRTMAYSGFFLLAFIVFHILQFTTRTIEPTPLAAGTVYANLYGAFQEWWLVVIYVAAVVVLGFHLLHALWSVLQTHGFDKPNRNPSFRRGATATAVLITLGFAAIPIAIITGALPEPDSASEPVQEVLVP
jgi:succinate dehydrogenase / fumarate reductase cytochrome b subunit